MTRKKHKNHGSSLEDFLQGEGILEDAKARSIKKVLAWQIAEEMKKQGITKTEMAELLTTSRTQLDRLLDPENNSVTLQTLQKAASILKRKLIIELV